MLQDIFSSLASHFIIFNPQYIWISSFGDFLWMYEGFLALEAQVYITTLT